MDRRSALDALTPIAAEQAGFLTARQARLLDVPNQVLVRLAAGGDLRRLRRGVYEIAHGRAAHPHEDLIAAWLSVDGDDLPWRRKAAPRGVVSHQSAAALHGLGTIIPGLPEITTRTQAGSRPGIRLITAPIDAADWSWRDVGEMHLPVTEPARTIVDLLLDREEVDYLERALRQVFADADTADKDLRAVATRRRSARRRGKLLGDLRALVSGADWPAP